MKSDPQPTQKWRTAYYSSVYCLPYVRGPWRGWAATGRGGGAGAGAGGGEDGGAAANVTLTLRDAQGVVVANTTAALDTASG